MGALTDPSLADAADASAPAADTSALGPADASALGPADASRGSSVDASHAGEVDGSRPCPACHGCSRPCAACVTAAGDPHPEDFAVGSLGPDATGGAHVEGTWTCVCGRAYGGLDPRLAEDRHPVVREHDPRRPSLVSARRRPRPVAPIADADGADYTGVPTKYAMYSFTRLFAVTVAGMLLFAPLVRAADPQQFASASKTCSGSFSFAPPTQPTSRSQHLVRVAVASGQPGVYGDNDNVYGMVGDVMWATGAGHSPFAAWGNSGYCFTASSLSATFYDVPQVPSSFSGRSTYTNGSNSSTPRASAPGGARYYADISVTQGSLGVEPAGLYYDEWRTVSSAARIELGYKAAGALVGVDISAQDGPPAQWTATLRPYPLAIADARVDLATIAPGTAVSFRYTLTNDATVDAVLVNAASAPVRSLASGYAVAGDATRTLTWDGLDATGQRLPDGAYRVVINGHDAFGTTASAEAAVTIDGTAPAITSISPANIAPQGSITVAITDPSGLEQASATQSQSGYSYPSSQTISAAEERLTFPAPSTGWKPGPINVDVTARDALGNAQTKRLVYSVTVTPGASPTPRPSTKAERASKKPTYLTVGAYRSTEGLYLRFKPKRFGFWGESLADSGRFIKVRWLKWSRHEAVGKGYSVALHGTRKNGHIKFDRSKIRLALSRVRLCGESYEFTRVRYSSRYGKFSESIPHSC